MRHLISILMITMLLLTAANTEWYWGNQDDLPEVNVSALDDMTAKEKADYVFKYCAKRIKYDWIKALHIKDYLDENGNYTVDYAAILETGMGICTDQATICCELMRLCGLQAFVAVSGGHMTVAVGTEYGLLMYNFNKVNKGGQHFIASDYELYWREDWQPLLGG